ncbi:aspartate dehydrogenase domain-containing protein [Myxococcus sp. AB036A]|uniref:aspartate dehydrogenase domain-containing protein n=1 Tax=Myxococcus sp. AB036A TaxID=2562793 RepID=UPI001146419A|nr:aspartate dehydrogenase domain-containing protein [Myxococcus sp. AB036A]
MTRIRTAIIGYGNLGQYLVDAIQGDPAVSAQFELIAVWNRTTDKLASLQPESLRYSGDLLHLFEKYDGRIDLVIEVCHPEIVARYGAFFLRHCDLIVGSPTAFADASVEQRIRSALAEAPAKGTRHECYLPAGALWGVEDIAKLGQQGDSIRALSVTMKKHPSAFKLKEPLRSRLIEYEQSDSQDEFVIFDGSVRELAPLAPSNVNTMACAALASGPAFGFDKTRGKIIADKRLESHVVEVELEGRGGFTLKTTRTNPARPGAVTGSATFASFLASLQRSTGHGGGFFFV